MSVPPPVSKVIRALSLAGGRLPSLINRVRLNLSDPAAPFRSPRTAWSNRVYQYTKLQTLLSATEPWQWMDASGSMHEEFGQESVWATSAHYMNDRLEYVHGCGVFLRAIQRRQALGVSDEQILWQEVTLVLDEKLGHGFFVACFSEKSDDLGQWRGYGDWGRGVCLGYDYAKLEVGPWTAGWVIYEPVTQDAVADEILKLVADRVVREITGNAALEAQIVQASCEILRSILPSAILLMKNLAFRDEAEYRLIQAEDMPSARSTNFRVSESRVIPFTKMLFEDSSTSNRIAAPLVEVVLGPGANDELNCLAVQHLLVKRGMPGIKVTPSPIPFLG